MALMLYKWFLVYGLSFFAVNPSQKDPGPETKQSLIHPFYLSVTEISHNASSKSLEISCKMFADDLEAIIEKNNKITLDITTGKDKPSFDKLIPEYISNHLKLSVDGKPVRMNYVGFENDNESAYVYFEVMSVASAKKIEVNNTILHDFTPQQINILHITVNGSRKSAKLDYPGSQANFNF